MTAMRFVMIATVALLSACASPEQRAEETANYINANYGPVCDKLGYTPGTDTFRDCMVSMFNADQAQRVPYYGPWGGPPARRR